MSPIEGGRAPVPERRRRRAWLALAFALAAVPVSAAIAPLPARLSAPPSPVVRWADGAVAHVTLAPDGRQRVRTSPEDVDPAYLAALLAYEDARFWHHPGVDPIAVARAAVANARAGRVVSGASTLTLQLVRMVEPRPRTLWSKVVEAWRAVGLEIRWSKQQILTGYLTFAPFGGNVEGVTAASHLLFGHGPQHLSAHEIAVLLAIPQAPVARAPGTTPDPAQGERLRHARDHVLDTLLAAGAVPHSATPEGSEARVAEARAAAVPTRRLHVPRHLPHVVAWLDRAGPAPLERRTHLRRDVSAQAAAVLARHRDRLTRDGIAHAAVVVLDPRTGAVEALLGGHDFASPAPGSQIPAFDVPRSPGSALKPLLHAMALDRGHALSAQRVRDVPVDYGGYHPDNYDGDFAGLVPLDEALARSLNVPYVDLLARIGLDAFLGALRDAGVTHLDPRPGHYGLAAAIGGLELTPLELAGALTPLAHDGRARPVAVTQDPTRGDGPAAGLPIVRAGAAWLTREALRRRDRPDFPARRDLARLPSTLAWKTGTSYGHRDAWAAAMSPDRVVVVWLGNLDQTPSRHLVGAEAAGGVLFDLVEALGSAHDADPRPAELVPVATCAWSGHALGAHCLHAATTWALPDAVAPQRCPFHTVVDIDPQTGLRLGPGCRGEGPSEPRAVLSLPAEVRGWLRTRGAAGPEAPSLAPGCAPASRSAPAILSPRRGEVVLLAPGLPASEQEVALRATAAPGARLSWFVDGRLLGQVAGDEALWWAPRAGTRTLTVVDDAGRSATITAQVEIMKSSP